MNFSIGELKVMEVLWDGECLDGNGEIKALKLSEIVEEKYGIGKTSCYTFLGRLVEKGAISRRYPKYTLKPVVSRDEALKDSRKKAIENLFQGSFVNVCRAFFSDGKITNEDLQEMKKIIDEFEGK